MSGIAVGLNKGYVVTKRTRRVKAVHRKGKLGERVKHIRSKFFFMIVGSGSVRLKCVFTNWPCFEFIDLFPSALIREVVGLAPYEKRIMEVLKGGGNNSTKRAHRFGKKRVRFHPPFVCFKDNFSPLLC